MERSDSELLHAAAAGEEAAFHELLDRRAPTLLRAALALCGNPSDAEDLCQETFVAAFRGMKQYQGTGSVKAWLARILVRRAGRLWGKRRRAGGTLSLQGASGSDEAARHDPGGRLAASISVPSATWAVDQRLDLLEAIQSLPPEFRETVVLREVEGMAYQEIADALGVPRGTVESRLHRARALLRQKLTGY